MKHEISDSLEQQDAFTLTELVRDHLEECGFIGIIWDPDNKSKSKEKILELWATQHCMNSTKICEIVCFDEESNNELIQIKAYSNGYLMTTKKFNPAEPDCLTDLTEYLKRQIQRYNRFIEAFRDIGHSLKRDLGSDSLIKLPKYEYVDFWEGGWQKNHNIEDV